METSRSESTEWLSGLEPCEGRMPQPSEDDSVVTIELENLDAIRSKHGDRVGNSAVLFLAQSLQGQLCERETAFRTDGGEMALLFEGVRCSEAASRAQAIVKCLNRLAIVRNGEEIDIYTSMSMKICSG